MPRTKAPTKKNAIKSEQISQISSKLEELGEEAIAKYNTHLELMRLRLKARLNEQQILMPAQIAKLTLGEIKKLPPGWTGDNTTTSILESTRNKTLHTKNNTTTKKQRSSSVSDDGYRTGESTNGTSGGGRQSRSKSRTVLDSTTKSRSVSRQKKPDRFKTPANKGVIPSSYGTVTPKVVPNTPQVVLRRPQQGELAISMQGSPLLTGSVMHENSANINIPLNDGRLMSIQPQKGLRMSQVPEIDAVTLRQLETLRENLNKVCEASRLMKF